MQPTVFKYDYPDLGCRLHLVALPPDPLQVLVEALPGKEPTDQQIAEAESRSASGFIDTAGRLPTVYDPDDDLHLRIYGVDRCPGELVSRYLATRPPAEFDWGLLKLQKTVSLGVIDKGDIPLMAYSARFTVDEEEVELPVCRRQFSFSYDADANGALDLTVTETPGWARNDGAWVDGPARAETYRGARYNAWRDSARKRIFEAYKTWLPLALVTLAASDETLEAALEAVSDKTPAVADIPAGEALTGGWLASNHAAYWNLYMETGRKELITTSITNDSTEWLDDVVPNELIPGLASGKTIREMILEGLR